MYLLIHCNYGYCPKIIFRAIFSTSNMISLIPARATDSTPKCIPADGVNTAFILAFCNKLSDAFNGKVKKDNHSHFRTLLTDTSFHLPFFDEATAVVSRMRYVDKTTKLPTKNQPSCLRNLKKTIQGFRLLWSRLKELGFTCLKTKHINQDVLENFFSLIRGLSQDRKPTPYHFIGIYKALVISNITQQHSKGANCQDDEGKFVLPWHSYFVQGDNERPLREVFLHRILPKSQCMKDAIPEKGSLSTDTAALTKFLKKKVPSFETCPECSTTFTESISSCGIQELHNDLKSLLRRLVPDIYATVGVKHRAKLILQREINIERVSCKTHQEEVLMQLLDFSISQYLLSISVYLTAVLRGKISFQTEKYPNASVFVISAKAKYDSSIKSKHHTFSTLSAN